MQLSVFKGNSTFHFLKKNPFSLWGRWGRGTDSGPNFIDRSSISNKGFTEWKYTGSLVYFRLSWKFSANVDPVFRWHCVHVGRISDTLEIPTVSIFMTSSPWRCIFKMMAVQSTHTWNHHPKIGSTSSTATNRNFKTKKQNKKSLVDCNILDAISWKISRKRISITSSKF
jgi:hypothetical protein